MKSKYFIWIVVIIIVLAGVKIFLPSEKKASTEKISYKIENSKRKITAVMEPSGQLLSFPKELFVYFSEPIFGTSGIKIGQKEIKNFISIEPPLNAEGIWTNGNTFKIILLNEPKPCKQYSVTIKKIPVKRILNITFSPEKFTFTTPDIKPLSVTPLEVNQNTALIKVFFNLPVNIYSLSNKVSITDKNSNKLKILDINMEKKRNKVNYKSILIKFKLPASGIYTLNLEKGIETTSGYKSKNNYNLDFSISDKTMPIIIKQVRVKDLSDSYSLNFSTVTLKNRAVRVKEEFLKNFISISPEISFEAYSTRGNLVITGKFKPSQSYTVILFSGLRGTNGEILKNNFKTTVKIPEHKPKLMFLYKGRYFGTKGEWKFPLVAKRLKKVKLSLYLIPEKNLTLWYAYAGASKWSVEDFGKTIFKNREIEIPQNSGGLYFIDLKKLIPKPENGIYIIKAHAYSTETKRNYRDNAKFTISNISIIAKWNKNSVALWTITSNSANPVKNAKITILDYSNIEIGKGLTDNNGYAVIKTSGGKGPYLITATTENDWTYIKLNDSKLPSSNFEISGDKADRDLIAYLYFERNLYRPGETINFSVIVRKNKTFAPVSLPVKIKVINPTGTKTGELNAVTDENGFAEFKFKTQPTSPTGQYSFKVYIGEKNILSSFAFVEAFAPQRMSLRIKLPEQINLKQPFTIETEAFYLFGAPAKGETLKGKLSLKEIAFSPEGYKNYSFGPLPYFYSPISTEETLPPIKVNPNGKNKIKISFKSVPEFFNPVKLKASFSLSEGGSGRVTEKSVSKTIFTKDYYIGLTCGSSKVTANVPLKIKGVVLDKNGKKIKGNKKLTYRLYKVIYNYNYYFYDEFNWRKNSTLIPLTEEKTLTATNGNFSINYIPSDSYDDIVVEVKGNNNFSQLFINGWGWFDSEKAETPETLILKKENKTYHYGETATVKTALPFEGKILWTIEADKVLSYKWSEAKGKTSSFSFKIPEGYPCVYVSALLIHTGDNYLVSRAFGITRIKTEPKNLKLNLKTTVPEKIKPGSYLTVKCKADTAFEATISIVDEGILQISNFKSPNPFYGILRPIALGVETADGLGWLVKKYLATGGGMNAESQAFPQPQFTKIVSFWSGKLKSDKNGLLKYKVKIPQYNGKLRVMVCAVSKDKLGGTSDTVTVKSDLTVLPTIPRFIRSGDSLEFPITLINNSKRKIKGTVEVKLTESISFSLDKKFNVPAGEKTIVYIPVTASGKIGECGIHVSVSSGNQQYYSENFKIPVFPKTPKTVETKTEKIYSGKTNIAPLFKNWESKGYSCEIYASVFPGLTKLHLAKELINYPYGCLEQISSKTLAMLKLKKLLPAIDENITLEKYSLFVQEGIGKILSMQTISGGFAYWPGGNYPSRWGSVYALLVLIQAKQSGFSVPQSSIESGLNYIQTLENLPPLGYYLLSKTGQLQKRPDLIQQIENIVKQEKLTLTSLMWYSATLYNCGKSELARTIYKKGLAISPKQTPENQDNFDSPLKAEAIRVFVGEEIGYDKNLIENLLQKLEEQLALKNIPFYYNTQETVWSMLAIGNYAEKYLKDISFLCSLTVDGKEVKGKLKNGIYTFKANSLPGKQDIVISSSKTPFFLEILSKGYKKKAEQRQINNGIIVEETLLNLATGNKTNSIKQGEEAIIIVRFRSEKGNFKNCALEIPLAAGLEAENPRLNGDSFNNTFSPDYIDIKDDKIIVFTKIKKSFQTIKIKVRGVTPGKFYFAPANANLMYKPYVNGKATGINLTVTKADGF